MALFGRGRIRVHAGRDVVRSGAGGGTRQRPGGRRSTLELDLDLARQHMAALEQLPRPTLISCRTGPRASAVAYMYAGLKAGATPAEVVAAAELDAAPFCAFAAYKEWVRSSMGSLQGTVIRR